MKTRHSAMPMPLKEKEQVITAITFLSRCKVDLVNLLKEVHESISTFHFLLPVGGAVIKSGKYVFRSTVEISGAY